MRGRKSPNGESFTIRGWLVCLWVLIIPFQYGYHISALNQIKAVLTCESDTPFPGGTSSLPTCIPMSNFVFSFVTAIFTVGGLAGSLVANIVMDNRGRKGAAKFTAALLAVGSGLMGISSSVASLSFGRFLVGVGSGVGICLGPIYIAEIAPSKISGSVGVLTQLGIVLGIMFTQIAGFRFSTPTEWRLVLFLSSFIGLVQFLTSYLVVETPAWLSARNQLEERKASSTLLWEPHANQAASPAPQDDDPLLDELEARRLESQTQTATVAQLFLSPDLHRPLMVVCFAMLSQQVSGINAVLYYSNEILSKSLPDWGPYVSLGITIVNVIMTFPPIILIERVGRKPLLVFSTLGALVSLIAIGYGLNLGLASLASIATLTFVTSYAVGLGPIPFVMIPEVSPPFAVSALSSVALSLNWIANFLVGLIFLPLRSFLSGGDPSKEGRVFYVFVIVLFSAAFGLSRVYRG